MKTKLIIILFASLLGCDQCEPDPPLTELEKLPPATQEGRNTFGCLVNGKAWVTKTSIDAAAFYQMGTLGIGADLDTPDQSIGLDVFDIGQPIADRTLYNLTAGLFGCQSTFYNGHKGINCYYSPEETISGWIAISRLDRVNLIVAGEFEFTTTTISCDTIRITDGRFDLTYAN